MQLPNKIKTLEEATDAFIQGVEMESDGQFHQSDVCALTCVEENRARWGMADEDILEHIGKTAERSRTTMFGRLLVGRVFNRQWRDDNDWCHIKQWSHFEVCARTWSEESPDAPYEWLAYCVDNSLSVRQLKMDIAAAKGEPPQRDRPFYLLDASPCMCVSISHDQMIVKFDELNPVRLPDFLMAPTDETPVRLLLTAVLEPDLTAVLVPEPEKILA
jgi:hypothetical protein